MYLYTLILGLALFWQSQAFARIDESTTGNYFIHNQIGANQGAYSLGLGYQGDWFEPSISFGYIPEYKSGSTVTQGNIKGNFRVFTLKDPDIQLLLGPSLLVNVSSKTFFQAPHRYPNKYYPPNAYFFALQASIRHHGFFVEASIIDYFLEVAARNKQTLDTMSDLMSVGIGYETSISWEPSDMYRAVERWF
ncbi:MAG: hypothetical protein EOP07_23910 [Proteobacteria bacterium]|nr:MAG: hypothetical protein EOP07_23910 [Pseudomonadota bacterium]